MEKIRNVGGLFLGGALLEFLISVTLLLTIKVPL